MHQTITQRPRSIGVSLPVQNSIDSQERLSFSPFSARLARSAPTAFTESLSERAFLFLNRSPIYLRGKLRTKTGKGNKQGRRLRKPAKTCSEAAEQERSIEREEEDQKEGRGEKIPDLSTPLVGQRSVGKHETSHGKGTRRA